jgi:Mn2+/Fe2+ NRAMP family transporter
MESAEAKRPRIRFWNILKVWGPAWLVMIADVDAASVITAAQSGAQYGSKLIWFLVLLAVPLFFIQEIAGRIGAVTGKGLGELIHQNFSKPVAIVAAVPMALVDIVSYLVEYAGAAIGFQMVGVSPWISVPGVFLAHLFIVYKRKYAQAEKPLFVISVIFAVAWIVAAVLTAKKGISFTPFYFETSPGFLFLLAANVGAVIMPFMLFYQASATAEKGTGKHNLWAVRLETAIGAIVSEVIMVGVLIATIGISNDSLKFDAPRVLSQGLTAVAGAWSPYLFGIGLITASFVALIVISLGSSWGVTEALGWGRKRWFSLYLMESIPAAIVVLIFNYNLINFALGLMVFQIVVLIGPAIIMGVLASKKSLMGEYALKPVNHIVYWGILALIIATGILSIVTQFAAAR